MLEGLQEYVLALRVAGTDLAHVAAKRARRKLPTSIRDTLSAGSPQRLIADDQVRATAPPRSPHRRYELVR